MNPRKRRAITRAVIAGIPKSKLNSDNIRKFLIREKERGSLKLTEECIEDILFPKGFINKPIETKQVELETIVEAVSTEVELTDEDEISIVEETVKFSIQNTKAELISECDRLNIEYKKSFSKSKLLKLINDN